MIFTKHGTLEGLTMSNEYANGYNQGRIEAANLAARNAPLNLGGNPGWEGIIWLLTKALWVSPILLSITLPGGILWGLFGLPFAYGGMKALAPDWTQGVRKWALWAGATAAIVGANLLVNGVWY